MDAKAMKKSENDFIFAKILGEGSFSTVYLAKSVDNNREYAIKVCDKMFITRNKKQEYIKREKEALLKLANTPGILRLIYSFQSNTHLFFVLTLAKNGDLTQYIKPKIMTPDTARFFSAELLKAIEGIHRNKIIHRDLKPQNCLLDSKMHLLVGDFGSAKILSEEEENVERTNNNERTEGGELKRRGSFVGTCLYVAPEILGNKPSQYSSDLFSYGCIVFQLLSGFPPFGTDNESEYRIFQQIKNIEYTFPDNFNLQGKDLVEKLLQFKPQDRLGAGDIESCGDEQIYSSIRNHEFFSSIDFATLHLQRSPLLIFSELQKNNSFHISDELEVGFGESQLRRIMQQELNLSSSSSANSNSNSLTKILADHKNHPWSDYVKSNEFIIKYGFVNKRKGFFARRRMLLLTSTPRLIYIDAVANVTKGEIPFDITLRCEPKNFKIFFVHTPNRTYFLEDAEGEALKWCKAIEDVRDKYCQA